MRKRERERKEIRLLSAAEKFFDSLKSQKSLREAEREILDALKSSGFSFLLEVKGGMRDQTELKEMKEIASLLKELTEFFKENQNQH